MTELKKQNLLQHDLENIPLTITLADATVPGPHETAHLLPESFQPHMDAEDAAELYERASSPDDVIRPWLTYAGMGVRHESDKSYFHAKPETVALEGLFHVALRINGRRTAIRYTPNEWGQQGSPFLLDASGGTLAIGHKSGEVFITEPEVLEPEAACLKNITYKSDGHARTVDQSITANPIQSCPMRCKFCRRQYDEYDEYHATRKELGLAPVERLVNLTPKEFAGHLLEKYPEIDWSTNNQISLVTGTFANFDHMHGYVERFVDEMSRQTDTSFDPRVHELQNIHILTHLARTPDQMRALKELGVKTIQDTAEIIDDDRRAAIMPKANPNNSRLLGKGEVGFAEVIEGVEQGTEIFGKNNYFVTVILGLDDYDTTRKGLRELKEAGLQHLDAPVYQPFQLTGLSLYRMAVRELISASLEAGEEFSRVSTTWNPKSLMEGDRVRAA